jgi:hypothetical protein
MDAKYESFEGGESLRQAVVFSLARTPISRFARVSRHPDKYRRSKSQERNHIKFFKLLVSPLQKYADKDLHLSTNAGECRDLVSPTHKFACEADSVTLEFLEEILDNEKPDFVAFTGDQVNGDSAPNAKSVHPLELLT